jgi:hypothetical protein
MAIVMAWPSVRRLRVGHFHNYRSTLMIETESRMQRSAAHDGPQGRGYSNVRLLLPSLPSVQDSGEYRRDPRFLWEIQKILISKRFVDLTHAFEPGIPHWAGFPNVNANGIISNTDIGLTKAQVGTQLP